MQENNINRNEQIESHNNNRSIVLAVISYCLIIFLFSGFISIIIGSMVCKSMNLSRTTMLECMANTNFDVDDPHSIFNLYDSSYIKINAIAQGYGNMLGYLLAMALVVFFLRKMVIDDFIQIKSRSKFYLIFIPVSAVLFTAISYGIDVLVSLVAPSSDNQSTIEFILEYGGAVPMIISVLIAPIVEELIYRKVIFTIFNKYSVVASYIISCVLFVLPHMISTDMSNMGMWLLQCVPYFVSAFMFAMIYHKSGYNVYASIAAHFLNNLLAVILILV